MKRIHIEKDAVILKHYYGQRLDTVLASLFPEYSRSQLSQWIKEGNVTLNTRACKPKEKVIGGEHIKLQITLATKTDNEEPENIPLSIVFEDEHLLIINKPAGLVVHPGAGHHTHTLVNALLYHDPSLQHLPRAGIIHRLDKDTTGLLIIAKTLAAHTQLINALQARAIHRYYTTLVHGHVLAGKTLHTGYGRHPHHRVKMSVLPHGKDAITTFLVHRHYLMPFTLLDVRLMTGRTHQIRVHMAHINHPVVGDPLYGKRISDSFIKHPPLHQALHQLKRQALHANKLSLMHPYLDIPIEVNAPLPADFNALLNLLENSNDPIF